MNSTEIIFLIVGLVLLLLVVYDFFFTTLSGSGAGFITRFVSFIAHRLLHFCVKFFGRQVYVLSGMTVNLMLLIVWVIWVWAGLFFLFSSDPEAIMNDNGKVANAVERLYFTGYTLSTLGLGNFKPTTPFFEILTSGFSFFGFVFFTSSMTYLISVSSAVMHKRSLALAINNLGRDPDDLAQNLLNNDLAYCFERFSSLQDMIDRHSVNHDAYPVLHFYGNKHPGSSLSINLATLDEAISILLIRKEGEKFLPELQALRNSISNFLNHMEQRYSRTTHYGKDSNANFPSEEMQDDIIGNDDLHDRRRVLGGLLKSENFTWADVYSRGG